MSSTVFSLCVKYNSGTRSRKQHNPLHSFGRKTGILERHCKTHAGAG
jgi:hypothetical protein